MMMMMGVRVHFEIEIEIEHGGMRVRGSQRRRVPSQDSLERIRMTEMVGLRKYIPGISGSAQVLTKDKRETEKGNEFLWKDFLWV